MKKIFLKKNFSIYWNRTYEPKYLKFDEFLSKNFKINKINFHIFKGNILNEFSEVKKVMVLPSKYSPLLETCRKSLFRENSFKGKKISKCLKKISYFDNTITEKQIYPNKDWFKKFDDHWIPSEENALKVLKKFISGRIIKYSDARNFPNIIGTSKLSPFIKHGQIHVETIWEECKKEKNVGVNKFLAEIGWREFNHSLINYFPSMLKKLFKKI